MCKTMLALAISAIIEADRQAWLDEKRRQFIASFAPGQMLIGGRRTGKTTMHRNFLRAQGVI